MAYRTKFFKMFPWVGGVNTSLDPATIKPNEVVQADHCIFSFNMAKNMRDGINFNWDSSSSNGGINSETHLGLCDFWYGSSSGTKSNFLMGIGSSAILYQWNKATGTRTAIPWNSTATLWPNPNTKVSFEVMNNALIFSGDGSGNTPKIYNPLVSSSATDLSLSAPQFSISRQWRGRLWTDDKLVKDRINYSPPGDQATWGGTGDSAAIDIGVGDGDPIGITAIFPSISHSGQPTLYIAKQTKLYQITGYTPEDYFVQLVSNGIGCVSHNAVAAIDQDDIVFVSENGIHSLMGTINYGDDESKFLSFPIQQSFNTYWTKAALPKVWACYLPQINSVAFAVTDTKYTAGTSNTAIWLYNIQFGAWYTWPSIDCSTIVTSYDPDQRRIYIGTTTGRIGKTFNNTRYDVTTGNSTTDITMTIKTGIIYIDQNPMVINGIKRFTMFYGPAGSATVTVTIQVDNYQSQVVNFVQSGSNSILGVNFVLGASVLGFGQITGPYSTTIDGYGRAFQATFVQSGQQSQVNLQGFGIEYETTGPSEETITSG